MAEACAATQRRQSPQAPSSARPPSAGFFIIVLSFIAPLFTKVSGRMIFFMEGTDT